MVVRLDSYPKRQAQTLCWWLRLGCSPMRVTDLDVKTARASERRDPTRSAELTQDILRSPSQSRCSSTSENISGSTSAMHVVSARLLFLCRPAVVASCWARPRSEMSSVGRRDAVSITGDASILELGVVVTSCLVLGPLIEFWGHICMWSRSSVGQSPLRVSENDGKHSRQLICCNDCMRWVLDFARESENHASPLCSSSSLHCIISAATKDFFCFSWG